MSRGMESGGPSGNSFASARTSNSNLSQDHSTVTLGSASPVLRAVSSPTPAATPASPPPEADNLEGQSKDFLIQRVRALERQLKIRNSDCARLLEERKQLLPLKEKCESQREMIVALRDQLNLAKVQCESANDAMEEMKRRQRNKEHRERVAYAERALYGANAPPGSTTGNTSRPATSSSANATPASAPRSNDMRRAPGGTVVNTTSGPQIIYDSSDISSVGFTKNAKLPYDFLGGPGVQLQYLSPYHGNSCSGAGEEPEGGCDASDDAQVRRTMATAAEAIEMDAKHTEKEDEEYQALVARLKALRDGDK
ncbi:hypothetical protein MNV84_06993 [Leishmania braziliensis]|nr:hypothetical protein MNV84_06993 [Leishmania braziliensis]CAJ2479795.1 unnamed protein product [Leishmania braziliensis]